jgi:hypothetical protein
MGFLADLQTPADGAASYQKFRAAFLQPMPYTSMKASSPPLALFLVGKHLPY